MRAGRLRRLRLRTSKSKRRMQKSSSKALQRIMTKDDETSQLEPAHSLLLSSLRYWEVERDLIEERVAALGR
jgi:ribosomal protein L32